MAPSQRLGFLRMYLLQLGADVNAAGKFRGSGDDRVEAVAEALTRGSGALAQAFWDDLKALAGEQVSFVESLAAGAAERLARRSVGQMTAFVTGLFRDKPAAPSAASQPPKWATSERAEVGRRLMQMARSGRK